jgi:hypothetical protein
MKVPEYHVTKIPVYHVDYNLYVEKKPEEPMDALLQEIVRKNQKWHKPWTQRELDVLLGLKQAGVPPWTIAEVLGRTTSAVEDKIHRS